MKRTLAFTATGIGLIVTGFFGAVIASWRRFDKRVEHEVQELRSAAHSDSKIVTEAMLEGLPQPVHRYLSYTGVVGKPMVETVQLHQSGAMHPSNRLPWIPLEADQYYSVNPPGFIWDGKIRIGPFPLMRARDRYLAGAGNMQVKVCSLFPVVNATGPEMDQGSMMRYLSEMIWFPSAFLSPNISFEPIDDHSAKVTFADHGRSVDATMYFDDEGRMTNLVAQRFRSVGTTFELATWETPITEYGQFEGLKLPIRGQAVWKLLEGDFAYIDVEITDIRYNEKLR